MTVRGSQRASTRQGENAATHPDTRGSRWAGRQQAESRRGRGAGRGNGPPLFTGWPGGPESSISPSGAEALALTLLTGSPRSPGSQRSKTAKGQNQQEQRPEPCLQGGRPAQKPHQGTLKVPTMLLHDLALCPQGGPFAQGAFPVPPLQPDAAPCLPVPHAASFLLSISCRATHSRVLAGAGAGLAGGHPGQIGWACKATAKEEAEHPCSRGLQPRPALQSARDSWPAPDLQGGPGPQGPRRLLLSD